MESFGKYNIVGEIGAGGMGAVYRAHDPVIGRDVAIKIVSAPSMREEQARKFFTREARSAGRLSHENIVTIYDVGEEDGTPFMVMEFLEGRDLGSVISADPPWPMETRLDIARQICRGLEYAHSQKVVHRDIKPGNIIVLDSGRVKILDFGIARLETETVTLTQSSVGTPRYMSPEQVSGTGTDHRSDIFSFGVLLYELLTGTAPFLGENVYTVIYKILNAQPEPIALDPAFLTDDLRAVVEKCLQKDVEARYQSFTEVIRDLDAVIAKHFQNTTETVAIPGGVGASSVTSATSETTGRSATFSTGVFVPPGTAASSSTDVESDQPVTRPKKSLAQVAALAVVGVMVVAAGGFWAAQSFRTTDEVSEPGSAQRIELTDNALTGGFTRQDTSPTSDTGLIASIPGNEEEDGTTEDRSDDSTVGTGAASVAADRARDSMNRARSEIYASRQEVAVAGTFASAEELRSTGEARYQSGDFESAAEMFGRARAEYASIRSTLKALEKEHHRNQALLARQAAEGARSLVYEHRDHETIARAFASTETSMTEANSTFEAGDYQAAAEAFRKLETTYEELDKTVETALSAAAPSPPSPGSARPVVDNLKSVLRNAVTSNDWSDVPKPLADFYKKNVSKLHKSMEVQEAMVNIDFSGLTPASATAELPVTLFLRLKQKGKENEDAVAIDSRWLLNSASGSWQLERVQK